MSSERDRKNLRDGRRTIALHEVKARLSSALVRTIPQYRNPAKEVAYQIDASEGTVENLRQRGVPDAMARLVMLALAYPDFKAEVARLMNMHTEINPDAQKLMSELVQLMQQRGT